MTSDSQVDEVLAAALRYLRGAGRVVVVGPGGIGKSTLVARVVDELAPDEVIAVAADLVDDAARVVSAILDSLGELTLGCESVAELLESALVGRRVAIVVDGADVIVDEVLSWSALVPTHGNGPWVVIASRVHPLEVVSPVVHLGPLWLGGGPGSSFAEYLFRSWYSEAGGPTNRLDAAPDALQRVLTTTGGVPLAIRVAAATAAAVGLDASEAVIAEGAGSDAVAQSIARSLARLTPAERHVLDAFAVSSGTVDAKLAAAIVERDLEATTTVLGRLVRHNLVDLDAGEYTMLPPVLRFVSANASEATVVARKRHSAWCLSLGVRPDNAVLLRREADVRLAIDRALADDPATAVGLTVVLVRCLLDTLGHHRAGELIDSVLNHPAVGAIEPSDRHLELLRLSAIVLDELQGSASALLALDEADQLVVRSSRPDYWGERLLSLRTSILYESGRVEADEALEMAMGSIEIAVACGDTRNELQTRHHTAIIMQDLGRLDEADAMAAIVIASCTEETRSIGYYARIRRAENALHRGDRALCASTGRRLLREAEGLWDEVEAEYLLTQADPARYAPQIKAGLAVDPVRPAAWELHLIAQTCIATAALVAGDPVHAMTVASDIVVIAEALPNCWTLLSGLLLMGDAALLCGDQQQALATYRQALVRANQQAWVLRAADAVDGLTHMINRGEDRRRALAASAALRRPSGATRRPRPWLPSLDTPRSRNTTRGLPAEWINGRRLSDTGVASIIASATDSLNSAQSVSDDPIGQLSPAERRVAELVAQGLTNREIGEQLHIARRTVETHIVHAFQKLGVQNRTQLARLVTS